MASNRKWKERLKEKISLSNKREKNGLPPDEWLVKYRKKNNAIKAAWKAKQPVKIPKKRGGSCTSFKKEQVPHNKKTKEENDQSLKRWRENSSKWQKVNKERINELARIRKLNPSNRIKANLRKRLSTLLRLSLVKKTEQTMDLLGCSIDEFKDYLEIKFQEGMTFGNYGEWHLDHIKPCYYFDLTNINQRKECFRYTNFQPLWRLDNLRKNKKMENVS